MMKRLRQPFDATLVMDVETRDNLFNMEMALIDKENRDNSGGKKDLSEM